MFALYAEKNKLTVRQREPVTSGSVNTYTARFAFSRDWDGLTCTAVFKAGEASVSVLMDETGECVVPWEVLKEPLVRLRAGVYGTQSGEVVLPTIWADLGTVLIGAMPSGEARPPTPDLWQQELAKKQDKLTGLPGQVVGFDENGNLAAQDMPSGGGGGGGTAYQFGHGLKTFGNIVSVHTVSDFTGDNTLPITAAGVQTAIGNIEALLGTI